MTLADDALQQVFLMTCVDLFLAQRGKDEEAYKRHMRLAMAIYDAYPEKALGVARALGAKGVN